MPSAKRHTTSNSGNSETSKKKQAASPKAANSSRNAPASFEAVFGKPLPADVVKFQTRIDAQKLLLEQTERASVPPTALGRTLHKAKVNRLRKQLKQLEEHHKWLTEQ